MNKEGLSSKDFLLGTVIGGLVGAATALLLAPKSGRELRSDINDQATYVRLKTEQMKQSALEKGQDLAVTAKDKTVQLSDTISLHSTQLVNKMKKTGEEAGEEIPEASLQVLEDEVENQPSSSDKEDIQQKLDEAKKAFDEVEYNMKP
ncbi:YtxH domain-containing protein [Priestia abyssalis]|uniref:YtxH domain-containing protein n=1 Tax=Priestia abyssalis TaxID=1221450 RepID=UPI0009959E58|nr:YtxH domain-containing protein [Priestia abyssalis]